MRRNKKKGNYAFIDNQNLNATVQGMGWKIDWRKFRKFLSDKHGVTNAYMFIGYVPEFEDMYERTARRRLLNSIKTNLRHDQTKGRGRT